MKLKTLLLGVLKAIGKAHSRNDEPRFSKEEGLEDIEE